MHNHTLITVRAMHDEYLRRNARIADPAEQHRHGLRVAIGHNLIHLGERLAGVDRHGEVGQAA